MNTHFDDPRLTAYLLDELSPEEKTKFEKELAANPGLARELEEIRKLEFPLQAALKKESEGFSLEPGQRRNIREKILENQAPQGFRFPWFMAFLNRPGLSFACALLLVGGCFFIIKDVVVIPRPWEKGEAETVKANGTSVVDTAIEEGPQEELSIEENLPLRPVAPEPVLAESGAAGSATATGSIGKEQVPLLGDIPITGRLFRSNDRATTAVTSPAASPARGKVLPSSGPVNGPLSITSGLAPADSSLESRYTAPRDSAGIPGRKSANAYREEDYQTIVDNPFKSVGEEPLSTFSIDVDTAAYTNLRRFLNQGLLPPRDAVRIEEMLNYFSYDYPQPAEDSPFSVNMEIASCPWNPSHQLAQVGIQGRKIPTSQRAPMNLVFLIDVSGSMSDENKLPLVKKALRLLVKELNYSDRVALVTYAGNSRLALPSTAAAQRTKIYDALDKLESGGSTNGEGGILQAYDVARKNFLKKGINRVILATDGDFNVGVSNRNELVTLIQDQAKSGVYLNIFGFGMGNLKDATLEQLANKGNGIYGYIDSYQEAQKVFAEQVNSTLITIAKDVKIQVEFNPAKVGAYRLIGYENRMLNKEDFNDDRKDAGEVGAGHSVTALYELVPAGEEAAQGGVDPLKYQVNSPDPSHLSDAAKSGEIMTLKLRYKNPEGGSSKLLKFAALDKGTDWNESSTNFRFAASVAAFGMVLRDSPHLGKTSYELIEDLATTSLDRDAEGYRREFVRLVHLAKGLKKPGAVQAQ